jgi:hypothetical protein
MARASSPSAPGAAYVPQLLDMAGWVNHDCPALVTAFQVCQDRVRRDRSLLKGRRVEVRVPHSALFRQSRIGRPGHAAPSFRRASPVERDLHVRVPKGNLAPVRLPDGKRRIGEEPGGTKNLHPALSVPKTSSAQVGAIAADGGGNCRVPRFRAMAVFFPAG